jgi:hypothetical protein
MRILSVEHCKASFKAEFALVIRRAKSQCAIPMSQWLENLLKILALLVLF